MLIQAGNNCYAQQPAASPYYSVCQYAVDAGGRTAYLWIPPDCRYVRGVIISLSNLLERNWLEDPLICRTASEEKLGIIWVGPGRNAPLTADLKPGAGDILQKMFTDLAAESGYQELSYAPIISMGHSANGQFSWNVAKWDAGRTFAAIPVKTVPLPASLDLGDVPLCYVVGETTEWPQFRVPDPATQPGDRDFFWPVVRQSALVLRKEHGNNLLGVVTDPGGGHFDWNRHQASFISLYIKKACRFRLPERTGTGLVKLKVIRKESGWLTDSGGMNPDLFPPAPYGKYKGDPAQAYWFFDEETARAAVAFQGDRKKREKQMLTFVQNGVPLPVAKQGFAALKFEPDSNGLDFRVEGAFLAEMPKELIGAGTPLGHAPGPIKFRMITGPAVQTGANTFRVQFDRAGMGGEIWIQEEHPGNGQYRHAVQPGQLRLPAKLAEGRLQTILFPEIEDQQKGVRSVSLHAISDAGLPVAYYVVAGPAVVERDKLVFTPVPVKSNYPVKVTVVAYQWGRAPQYQSAEPVTRVFYLQK